MDQNENGFGATESDKPKSETGFYSFRSEFLSAENLADAGVLKLKPVKLVL